MLIPSIDLMGGKAVQLVGGRTKVLEVDDVLGLAQRWRVSAIWPSSTWTRPWARATTWPW